MAKRIIFSIGVIFGVLTITFLISRLLVPDPARAWAGEQATPQVVAALRAQFHLNQPLPVQYYYYIADLFRGNWGISPSTGQPVLGSILFYLPATIELTISSLILMVIIGIPLGVVAATHRNRLPDHLARIVSFSGTASPSFLVSLILQLLFFYYLRIFPDAGGRISPFVSPPSHITGLYTVDSLITGNWVALFSSIQHLILPSFAVAFLTLGLVSRLTRASMLESLSSDYVRTAKSKGMKRRVVIYKHALKNALIQPMTALSVYMAYLLGGAIVVESIFSWPGIGRYTAEAAINFDLPVLMGTTLVFAIGVIVSNLFADILIVAIDPRIKLR